MLVVSCSFVLIPPATGEIFGPNVRVNIDTNLDRNVPAMAVGWDGTVYAAWQDKASGSWRIMLAHEAASGSTFTGHVQVASSAPAGSIEQSPDIGYFNGTVYVVWQDNRNTNSSDIYFSAVPMPLGVPGPEKKINSEWWPGYRQAPAIAVAPNGTIYVAYNNETVHIRLVASYDGGQTWTASALVSGSTFNFRGEQRVAVDPLGKVYVVWRDGRSGMIVRPGGTQVEDDDVYIANSTDGGRTFGPNTPVNDVIAGKVQSSPTMAIDGYGRVHVAWKDERLEANEATDIFYARSDDGKTFGPNRAVNDSAPVFMAPRRTTHQQPWIALDPTGTTIYIAWVDDRAKVGANDSNHNVYLFKSVDGGLTFHPGKEVDLGAGATANLFIDDASSYNGVWDSSEAAFTDNGNGVLDPGVLDGSMGGSPDKLESSGIANLGEDLAGDYIRYHDANSDNQWTPDEDIIMSGPAGAFPKIRPASLTPWDTTGQGLSLLYFNDGIAMKVDSGKILAVDGFDTDGAGLTLVDPISDVSLELVYRANSTYTGTASVQWSLQNGVNNTWFAPVDTSDVWTNMTLNLYSLGVTTVAELRDMNVSFVNNGAGNVTFDRMSLNITRGLLGSYDRFDIIAYHGTTTTSLGDSLTKFNPPDKIVFVDVNMTGHYDQGDPLIHTASITGAGGYLSPSDEVLTRGDAPQWRTMFNSFPLNDDTAGNNHFMPRIALNPFGYINAMWQDWRGVAGPNIYACTAQAVVTLGPYMAFYLETDQKRAGPGGRVVYRIYVKNIGGVAAAGVDVRNQLPLGLDFVQSNPSPDQTVGRELRWQLGAISVSGMAKLVVEARVNASVQLNTILWTRGRLNFTDLLGTPQPSMYGGMNFIASDLQPPTIVHTPVTEVQAGGSMGITATVTDESGVAEVRLYVKPVGAVLFNPAIPMGRVGSSDNFTVTYTVGAGTGTLEYYIEAVDTSGNVGLSPSGAPSQAFSVQVVAGPGQNEFPVLAVAAIVAVFVGILLVIIMLLFGRKKKLRELAEEEREEEESRPT